MEGKAVFSPFFAYLCIAERLMYILYYVKYIEVVEWVDVEYKKVINGLEARVKFFFFKLEIFNSKTLPPLHGWNIAIRRKI